MREVVFVDGARSIFGRQGGGLKQLCCSDIASLVMKGLLERNKTHMAAEDVDAVVCGSAQGDIKAFNPARYAALGAGLPVQTECHYMEMQCGSAITSINHAAAQIALGYADVILAGGMESHSTSAVYFDTTIPPYRQIGPRPLVMHLAPTPEQDISMLQVSDQMAAKWKISREQCDEFALRSQSRLQTAYRTGITGAEIIPYTQPASRKEPEKKADRDEHPRPEATMEGLRSLSPVLEGGVTTAGNASGKNDGAAFVLLMSAEKARELGYVPYARWVTGADVGVEPRYMGIGPVFSSLKALKAAGLTLDDLDVFECNEAFAAQNLCVISELEHQTGKRIDPSIWNPNGGAIAIGHPNGASGARIAWFAVKQLERTGGKYGLFSACCGGGHGTTAIIENLRR
ncbi:thiolase family protein [uncultured Oscillibacter sp.]|uniref:thiolase family protein n=1 Tax=uncultured Oscillibacter sp. TaxID=876091 RepID=UPI002627123B|nr:thiolase family protein [uncultured Oscillibacter sp.]